MRDAHQAANTVTSKSRVIYVSPRRSLSQRTQSKASRLLEEPLRIPWLLRQPMSVMYLAAINRSIKLRPDSHSSIHLAETAVMIIISAVVDPVEMVALVILSPIDVSQTDSAKKLTPTMSAQTLTLAF